MEQIERIESLERFRTCKEFNNFRRDEMNRRKALILAMAFELDPTQDPKKGVFGSARLHLALDMFDEIRSRVMADYDDYLSKQQEQPTTHSEGKAGKRTHRQSEKRFTGSVDCSHLMMNLHMGVNKRREMDSCRKILVDVGLLNIRSRKGDYPQYSMNVDRYFELVNEGQSLLITQEQALKDHDEENEQKHDLNAVDDYVNELMAENMEIIKTSPMYDNNPEQVRIMKLVSNSYLYFNHEPFIWTRGAIGTARRYAETDRREVDDYRLLLACDQWLWDEHIKSSHPLNKIIYSCNIPFWSLSQKQIDAVNNTEWLDWSFEELANPIPSATSNDNFRMLCMEGEKQKEQRKIEKPLREKAKEDRENALSKMLAEGLQKDFASDDDRTAFIESYKELAHSKIAIS